MAVGLPGVKLCLILQAGRLEVRRPVEAWCLRGEVGHAPQVVRLVHVLAVEQAGVRPGDFRLQCDDGFRLGLRVGDAGLLQQRADIGQVLVACLDHVRIAGQVVVAAGQAETTLQQVGDVPRRIFQPLRDEQAEQILRVVVGGVDWVDIRAQAATQHAGQILARGDRVDPCQLGLERAQAVLLDRGGIHPGGVVVGDLARVAAGGGVTGPGVADRRGGILLRLLEHLQEGAGTGAVGRDLRGTQPSAIGVTEEVVARSHAVVDAGQVNADRAAGWGCRPRGRAAQDCRRQYPSHALHGQASVIGRRPR